MSLVIFFLVQSPPLDNFAKYLLLLFLYELAVVHIQLFLIGEIFAVFGIIIISESIHDFIVLLLKALVVESDELRIELDYVPIQILFQLLLY